jgi:hypothetical protein
MLRRAVRLGLLQNARVCLITAHPLPPMERGLPVFPKPLDFDSFVEGVHELASGAGTPGTELVLYVSSGTTPSMRAERLVREVTADYWPAVHLRVLDPRWHGDSAERDRIVVTPTLICRREGKLLRVVGEPDRETVLDVLGVTTAVPAAPVLSPAA